MRIVSDSISNGKKGPVMAHARSKPRSSARSHPVLSMQSAEPRAIALLMSGAKLVYVRARARVYGGGPGVGAQIGPNGLVEIVGSIRLSSSYID